MNSSRIIVSLDFPTAKEAHNLTRRLDPGHCRVKVGKELFTISGPAFIETLVKAGFDVFLDMKFHDIPNTVAGACRSAAGLGVWMINLHVSGGRKMLEAGREAVDKSGNRPLLIGVTVLTSLTSVDLNEIGVREDPGDLVLRLSRLAQSSGLDGVVCSPLEVSSLRKQFGNDFVLVTPGIRPQGTDRGDQQRILTPSEAISAGSDYLVIGRPITQAADPLQALMEIEEEINAIAT